MAFKDVPCDAKHRWNLEFYISSYCAIFSFVTFFLCVCNLCVRARAHKGQEKKKIPMKLELQVVVSCPVWC